MISAGRAWLGKSACKSMQSFIVTLTFIAVNRVLKVCVMLSVAPASLVHTAEQRYLPVQTIVADGGRILSMPSMLGPQNE